jgi:ribosome maturation factor RimP
MTHPLIPHILELANPVAAQLNLEVVEVVFQTNQHPPVLRINIRNPEADTGLENCEQMSHALEPVLESSDLIPDAYILEISSPGLSDDLSNDRDFRSFRGFPVVIDTDPPFQGRPYWEGTLVERDDQVVRINQRGRAIAIPRGAILRVQLQTPT